ncbi:hypothetical protein Y694_04748 [Methylibium sp. T29-B]|nr:hypothetical protein Y694_04748 [Methylibium sp. T29-B]
MRARQHLVELRHARRDVACPVARQHPRFQRRRHHAGHAGSLLQAADRVRQCHLAAFTVVLARLALDAELLLEGLDRPREPGGLERLRAEQRGMHPVAQHRQLRRLLGQAVRQQPQVDA